MMIAPIFVCVGQLLNGDDDDGDLEHPYSVRECARECLEWCVEGGGGGSGGEGREGLAY